jgi:hypothetical protein
MGDATKTLEELRLTNGWSPEAGQQWFLDATTGELKPEDNASERAQTRPQAVRVARQTFD